MPESTKTWMIYGANGYTGRLIARLAAATGRKPILAGRDRAKIEAIAKELDCPSRVFSLDSAQAAAKQLAGVSAVLHCAGPFSRTAEPMIGACLAARVNYMDITGEWDVIELAARQHDLALAAGISIMPAVGFDVVPSDCLAAQLAAALPSAVQLELAFRTGSSISPGTAISLFAWVGRGGRVRQDGQIIRVPTAWKDQRVPFPRGQRQVMSLPWGDISSAFYTTGIPNIHVYSLASVSQIRALRRVRWLLPITRIPLIQWLGRHLIKWCVRGPDEVVRATRSAEFWGRVTDGEGQVAEATLVTPEGYALTAQTAFEIMRRTLAGEVAPGFSTPAQAFGGAFIEQFDGVQLEWRTSSESRVES